MLKKLNPQDQRQLEAAQIWFELGNLLVPPGRQQRDQGEGAR